MKGVKITARNTLIVIENHCAYLCSDDKEIAQIYMWAHTALYPKGRKNHPSWTKDLLKEIKSAKSA